MRRAGVGKGRGGGHGAGAALAAASWADPTDGVRVKTADVKDADCVVSFT